MKLKDVIGKEIFLFEEREYTDDDFLKMSADDLATFKARVNLKITNIADIIEEKRREESRDWYKRRKYALSLHTKMIPYLNSLLKQRYKKERNFADYFFDEARRTLPPKDFEAIMSNAQIEKEQSNG